MSLKTEWGCSREELNKALNIMNSILNQELAKGLTIQRRHHEQGHFDAEDPSDRELDRMSTIFETCKLIEKCMVVKEFLQYVKTGSL